MALKTPLLIILGLSSLLAISTVVTIESNYSTRLIQGEDCTTYHNDYLLDLHSTLEASDESKNNGSFSIIFSPTAPEMIFTAEVILRQLPDNSTLNQVNATYEFTQFVYPQDRVAKWNVTGLTQANGEFTADINLTVRVPDNYRIHPGYEATYAIELRHNVESTEISIYQYLLNLQWFDINLTNQLLSYFSYIFIALVAILGMPGLAKLIEVSIDRKVSNKTIRNYHCTLGKLSAGTIALHGILSLISPMWLNILKLWILPTGYIPNDIIQVLTFQDSKFGLEIGRWATVLLFITLIGGIVFSRLTRKIGRKSAILLQQLSYLSLFLIAVHALIVGTLARDISLFATFTWSVLILVFGLRLILYWFNKETKKLQTEEKVSAFNTQ